MSVSAAKTTGKRVARLQSKKLLFIWLGLAIPLINLAVFWVYINIDSLFIAFEHTTNVGKVYNFDNFKSIFIYLTNPNSTLPGAIFNTLKFFAWSFFVTTPLCYVFAYFIYKKIAGYQFFRYVFFLPSIVSAVVLTTFVKFMLTEGGDIYKLWELIAGVGNVPQFLADQDYAFNILLLYNLWTGFGVTMIYFYSAFARIPKDILEYGKLDGLSSFRELVSVILPLTWPTYSMFVVLGIGTVFSASGPVLLLTYGAAGTYDLSFWTFYTITKNASDGVNLVAALGQLQTLITLPLALFARWISGRIEAVEY